MTCVLSAVAAAQSAAPATQPIDRPNIVLLIGEAHSWPDFGFMESPKTLQTSDGAVSAQSIAPTTNLNDLAASGVVFTRGYSSAASGRMALQTLLSASGLHPTQWDTRRSALQAERPLGKTGLGSPARYFRTLPRELLRYGYVSWRGGRLWDGTRAEAGFTDGAAFLSDIGPAGHSFGRQGWSAASCGSTSDATVACPALEPLRAFLDTAGTAPFFLWIAPALPHGPYDAPQEYREPFEKLGLGAAEVDYLSNIRWADELYGEVVREIADRGLREKTLFIYVSAYGGGPTAAGHKRNPTGPYDVALRTPVIFAGPGVTPARYDDLILTSDLVATILGYVAGARPPADSVGINLRPRLAGELTKVRTSLMTHGGGDTLVNPPWRYVRDTQGNEGLFRIDRDPFESTNLAEDHPDLVHAFREQVYTELHRLLLPLDTGEVLGRVLNPFGAPVIGAQLKYGAGPKAQVVSTDAGGYFLLGPWKPPTTVIRAGARMSTSYFWKEQPLVPPLSLSQGILFEIIGALRDKAVDVPVGARIVVRVVDSATGAPVAHAHVRARATKPLTSVRTYTDENGYAWLEGLPANRYRVMVKGVDHRHRDQSDIVLGSAADAARLTLAVQRRPRSATRAPSNTAR